MPIAETTTFVVSKRCAESPGPSEDDTTASPARKKGRTTRGTPGRSAVKRKRLRSVTGSGIQYAPAKAIANRTSRTTYGRTSFGPGMYPSVTS
jgi:hypothetical protein